VQPGNVAALAHAMETILADRPRWQERAADMRAYAERKFNPKTMVASHLALYRDMLAGQTLPARRRTAWMDPVVRLAIKAYWRGSRVAS
jgi:hypothetical protein